MRRYGFVICAAAFVGTSAGGASVVGAEVWVVDVGELTLNLEPEALATLGLWGTGTDTLDPETASVIGRGAVSFLINPASDFTVLAGDESFQLGGSTMVLDGGIVLAGESRTRKAEHLVLDLTSDTLEGRLLTNDGESVSTVLTLLDARVSRTVDGGAFVVTYGELRFSKAWSAAVGRPELSSRSIGSAYLRARLVPLSGLVSIDVAETPSLQGASAADSGIVGPDIIVADIFQMNSYGSRDGVAAFAIGTTSCNIGDEPASWIASNPLHPVIAQNVFRLRNDRFEQIGMSWLKHGFWALTQNLCGTCQPPPGGGSQLGVNCSDPYTASLNGQQGNLGPRYQVNPHTGSFPYPPASPAYDVSSPIPRRIQVHKTDLDPALNSGAEYFAEAQYVTADDALAGNGNNNVSYRRIAVVGPESNGEYRAALLESTQRQQAGIRAWQDRDPSVTETEMQVPDEGLFILAANVNDLGLGQWEYEYAVQNVNSHRACKSFTVPLPDSAIVWSIGFHDVDYHSGEPSDGSDWVATVAEGSITWQTSGSDADPTANALRWGTLYNFRFQTNVAPEPTMIVLGLFRAGFPAELAGRSIGPAPGLIDCNSNGITDMCDVQCRDECGAPCGKSADCNYNGMPDECEPDCNANGISDECDIHQERSADCQTNGIPDECDSDCDGDGVPDDCAPPEDCDADGILDCNDLCRCTSPVDSCICPAEGECCWNLGFCLDPYLRSDCIESGGTPDCLDTLCRAGCTFDQTTGDFDGDGDRDVRDFWWMMGCFSGPSDRQSYVSPSIECVVRFDLDGDGDVDLDDHRIFHGGLTGPDVEFGNGGP